jgi:hypothetical protein
MDSLLEKCPTAVRNCPGPSLASAKHRQGESIYRSDVPSLEALGKCWQSKSFSQPRATAGRDRAS